MLKEVVKYSPIVSEFCSDEARSVKKMGDVYPEIFLSIKNADILLLTQE